MNYELAKQLKDAGFSLNECELDGCSYIGGSLDEDGKNYHYPTLEELIEACGRTIQSGPELYYFTLWGEPHEWQAGFTPLWKEAVYANALGEGSTPTEAVANLWLVLNKVQLKAE